MAEKLKNINNLNRDEKFFYSYLIENLNNQQKEAVTYDIAKNRPILIIAGAGSGKTATLIRRIAFLLLMGFKPDEIIAVTFTKKAAEEMKHRLYKLLTEDYDDISDEYKKNLQNIAKKIKDMWIGTFHSMCLRLLKEEIVEGKSNIELLGIKKHFRILDEGEVMRILNSLVKEGHIQLPAAINTGEIKSFIDKQANELKSPKISMKYAKTNEDIYMANIYEIYDKYKKKHELVDFGDMIYLVNYLLASEEHKDIRKYYQNKFKYFLIDEYQDTNMAQYVFSKVMVEKNKRFFAVGDNNQSIYLFRGADNRILLQFNKDYPNAKIIKLEYNYRSTPTIIDVSNEIFKKDDKFKKIMKPANEALKEIDPEKIIIYSLKNEVEEAEFIVSQIDYYRKKKQEPYKNFAVFIRTNDQAAVFREVFAKYKIPFKETSKNRFIKFDNIRIILNFLKLLEMSYNCYNEADKCSRAYYELFSNILLNIFSSKFFQMPRDDIRYLEDNIDVYKILFYPEIFNMVYSKLSLSSRKILDDFLRIYNPLIEDMFSKNVSRLIEELIEKFNIQFTIDKNEYLKKLFTDFFNISNEYGVGVKEISAFLNSIREKNTDEQQIEDADKISLMTIHSAKGLEFNTVFFTGLEEGICPFVHPGDSELEPDEKDKRLEEEKRLFYVGITRAMIRLYITYVEKRRIFGIEKDMQKSRFLKLLPKVKVRKGGTNLNLWERIFK